MRIHGGLGMAFSATIRHMGYDHEPCEMQSVMWESLPDAIHEYDPKKGKAATCWGKVVKRYSMRYFRSLISVGSVKVSRRTISKFSKETITEVTELLMSEKHDEINADSAMQYMRLGK